MSGIPLSNPFPKKLLSPAMMALKEEITAMRDHPDANNQWSGTYHERQAAIDEKYAQMIALEKQEAGVKKIDIAPIHSRILELQAKPAFLNQFDPDHRSVKQEVENLYDQITNPWDGGTVKIPVAGLNEIHRESAALRDKSRNDQFSGASADLPNRSFRISTGG
jgi:hypothetical protein